MFARDFEQKVLPLNKRVFRFARLFLKEEDAARDVVQDIFLKLWQKKEELHRVENLEAFIMRMTHNRCVDVIRARKTAHLDFEITKQAEKTSQDVHSKIELRESAEQIRQLINLLPDMQRKVMMLRDLEQLEYQEIAELTGLEVNAVRVNLSRARKKVRDEYLKINANERQKNRSVTPPVL